MAGLKFAENRPKIKHTRRFKRFTPPPRAVNSFGARPGKILTPATSAHGNLLAVATRNPDLRLYAADTRARKTSLPKVPTSSASP